MKDKLMKLSELGFLLEYDDERTIMKWCKRNKIPVIIAGKAKYVPSAFIDTYFNTEITKFVNHNYDNPSQIMDAIDSDNPLELSTLLKAPVNKDVAKKYKAMDKERSKAANDFLKNIKNVA